MSESPLPKKKKPKDLREAVPGLKRLLPHVRPHLRRQRTLIAGGGAAMALEVVMRLLEPWPMKFVIDGVVGQLGADLSTEQPANLQQVLVLACLGLLVVVLVRAAASYAMTVCFALAGNRLLTSVRADAFAHLQKLSLTFHDKARTGDLVQRITSDVGRLKEVAVTAALPLIGNLLTLVAMLVVVFVLDWQLALCMLVVFPIFFLTGRSATSKIHDVSRKQRKAEGQLATLATEALGSMKVVQAYTLEGEMQSRFASDNVKTLKDGVKAKKLSAGLERSTDVLVGLATALVLYIGAQRVLAGALTPGELVVFVTYLKAAFKPMRDLAKYTGRIAQAAASAERVVDLLETVPAVRDASWARAGQKVKGHIELCDVWLSYVPGHPVLRGIDLRVSPGSGSPSWAPPAPASPRSRDCCCGCRTRTPGPCASTAGTCRTSRSTTCAARWPWCSRTACSLPRRSGTTSPWVRPRVPVRSPTRWSCGRHRWLVHTSSSPRCPRATTPSSPNAARPCRVVSVSGSPSPERWCAMRRSSSSTRRRPVSTVRPRSRSPRPSIV